MDQYGERLKFARENIGSTQEELGKKVGVTGVAIMRYEKGQRQPRFEVIQKLADALNVDTNWLINGYTTEEWDNLIRSSAWKQMWDEIERGEKMLLNNAFERLNTLGQNIAVQRVEELTKIPEYQKEPQKPQEAPMPTDSETTTEDGEKPPEGPTEPDKNT